MANNTDAIRAAMAKIEEIRAGAQEAAKAAAVFNANKAKYGQAAATAIAKAPEKGITAANAPATKKEDSAKESSKKVNALGYVADKTAAGAAEGVEGVVNAMSFLGQLMGKQQEQRAAESQAAFGALIGNKELAKSSLERSAALGKELYGHNKNLTTLASFGDKKAAEVEEKYADADIGKGLQFAGDVAQGIGSFIPAAVTNFFIPGSGLAVSAMSAAGNAVQEAKNEGKDDAQAMLYGSTVGMMEAAVEKLTGGMAGVFGKGIADESIESIVKSYLKNETAQKAVSGLMSAIGEGGEEFVTELGNRLANELIIDTDDRSFGETLSDAGRSFLIGSVVGGIVDTAGSIGGKAISAKDAAAQASQNIKKRVANKPQNSPSGGVSAEAANNAVESGNADVGEATKGRGFLGAFKATANEISSYIERALSRSKYVPDAVISDESYDDLPFAEVSENLAQKIYSEYGIDISDMIHTIRDNNLRHIYNRHGPHTKEKNPVIAADLKMIPTIINDASEVYYVPRRDGKRGLVYEFQYGDDATYYLEQIIDGNKLVNAQMIKTPAGVVPDIKGLTAAVANKKSTLAAPGAVAMTAQGGTASPQMYAQNVWHGASGNSIPQGGGNSNSQSVGAAASRNYNAAMEAWRNGDITKYARLISGVESVAVEDATRAEQPESPVTERDGGIFGHSVGAAQYAEGKQVDTENKAITQNEWMTAEQRAKYAPGTHEQITNALSMARAQERLMTDADGNILYYDEMVEDLLNEPRWTGVDEDFAQLLMQEASRREDTDTLTKLADRLSEEGTLAGQALQARQKWISDTPEGKLVGIVRATKEIAQDHKARKGTEIKVSDELIKKFTAAQTDSERNAVIGEMQEEIAKQIKPTAKDVWTALRYTNMLGNFKTQERNLLGNLTMSATYRVKDAVGALAEAIADKASGGKYGRTKSALVGGEWMKAAKQDYAAVESRIFSAGKYNDANFRSEFEQGVEDKRTILPVGLEQYRRATNWAMTKGDVIFSKAAYARSLAGYLKANGATPAQLAAGTVDSALLGKARDYAVKQAQETTLRDSNKFSDWASKALRGEDVPALLRVVGEGLAPFRKTPANALVRAIEYSPLGVVNTAYKAVQAKKGSSDITGADVIDSLAKTLTGTGLFALGMVLEDMGLIRATGDDDDEAIDSLMGRQDYALVIPGVGTYTLDWMSVPALTMFTGAQFMDLLSDEELTFAEAESAITSLAEPLIQMSMLSGINDTLSSIKYSDNNLLQMVTTLAVGYVTQGTTNTLLGQLERSSEGNRMSTYVEQDSSIPTWLQRSIGKASAKTPGWDYQQTEYLDEFGNTESGGGWLENLFSPGYFEPTKEGEKVYDFAQWAHDTLGVDAFPEAYAPNDVEQGGEKYILSQKEKEQYQKTRGGAVEDYLKAADSSGAFDELDKEQRRDVLAEIMSLATQTAKAELLESRGVDAGLSDKDAAIQALSSGDVVKYYSLITGFKALEDGATASEAATMEKLMEQPVSSSIGEIIMEGDYKKMYDATQAGVSVRDFCTVRASIKNAQPAAGYSSIPQWQEFNTIGGSSLSEADKLTMIKLYGSESAAGKVQQACDSGIALSDILAYYEAVNSRNSDGTNKSADEKRAAANALGLDAAALKTLNDIF